MDVKGYFFGMDGKRRILIVNFLGHIQVAFGKMHLPGSNYSMGFMETHRSLGAPLNYDFN
jgi:hypothetical protein